ncbi:MAG TPA: FHA domain-containing protein [Thermoanaerobaculia bacterium]
MADGATIVAFAMRYDFAEFNLDTDARQLRRGSEAVHLSPKALDLLIMLIAERPRAVPKRELYDRLWPSTFVVDANLPVLIREVRGALRDNKRQIIRTVHGTGYAFAAAVPTERQSRDGFMHLLFFDNQQIRLEEGENLVGREPSANVFLPSASVSRRHALITVHGEGATVTDLDSKNGTFLGSEPLHGEAPLADGTIVQFGEIITRYRCCLPEGATDTF